MAEILEIEYEALDLTPLVKYRDHWPSIVNMMVKFDSVGGAKCLHQFQF